MLRSVSPVISSLLVTFHERLQDRSRSAIEVLKKTNQVSELTRASMIDARDTHAILNSRTDPHIS